MEYPCSVVSIQDIVVSLEGGRGLVGLPGTGGTFNMECLAWNLLDRAIPEQA